jgi:hypothetical protein
MQVVRDNGSPFTSNIYSYSYAIDPSTNSTMPFSISQQNLLKSNVAYSIPAIVEPGHVYMPTYNSIATFTNGPIDLLDSFGTLTPTNENGARTVGGIAPGLNVSTYDNGGASGNEYAQLTPSPTVVQPIVWDDANINTYLKSQATGVTQSTVTSSGFLNFILGTFTVHGRTLTNFFVLTSFDGSKYYIINMIGGDANAIAAISPAGNSLRTGHITADGNFWYQNSIAAPTMVFAGLLKAPLAYISSLAVIPLPEIPILVPPLY